VLSDTKTEKIAELIRSHGFPPIRKLLVVGCGTGIEAAILAQQLDAEVIGIDDGSQHGMRFDPVAARYATLVEADVHALNYADASFDFVYSFHALEHISAYRSALEEMRRVLKVGSGYFVGTPNRHRIVGYLGAKPGDLTWAMKLYLNVRCWKAMLLGRFRNELGAHAGFTFSELGNDLLATFGDAHDVSSDDYKSIYPNHKRLLRVIDASPAREFIYPSVHFMGVRADSLTAENKA
jgi:SAM-dependent methyltransferase